MYTPLLTGIIPSISASSAQKQSRLGRQIKSSGIKMQVPTGKRKQENIEMARPNGVSEGTMTDMLDNVKMREGCLASQEYTL